MRLEGFIGSEAITYSGGLSVSEKPTNWGADASPTDEKHQTICGWGGGLGSLYLEQAHARDNGANKVYVEDREYVHKVKYDSNCQESEPRERRHVVRQRNALRLGHGPLLCRLVGATVEQRDAQSKTQLVVRIKIKQVK